MNPSWNSHPRDLNSSAMSSYPSWCRGPNRNAENRKKLFATMCGYCGEVFSKYEDKEEHLKHLVDDIF